MADNKSNTEKLPAVVEKSILPAETAKLYKLVNFTGGHTQVFGKYGKINFSTLTVDQAARLVKIKFPKIAKK